MATDIDVLIENAETRANDLKDQALTALAAALRSGILTSIGTLPTLTLPTLSVPSIPAAPVLPSITIPSNPSAPARPSTGGINTIDTSGMPATLTVTIPTITEPVKPTQVASWTRTAPTLNLVTTLPDAPAAFVDAAPTLSTVVLPTRPTRTTPNFTGVRPADVAAPPDVVTAFTDAYRAASPLMISALEGQVDAYITKMHPEYFTQLGMLEAKLASFIAGETETGYSARIEDAIFERARSKTDAETRRSQDEALTLAAKRGFTLPDGALMTALGKARQAGSDNNSAAARDIMIKQAEIAQENMKFAITTSSDMRKATVQASISYHSNLIGLNGQAIQYAQHVMDAMVKLYDLAVEAFKAKLDGYRADVSVFEALIRASLADIELYKAAIEGERAKVALDEARVNIYRSQILAHQSAVDSYKANIDAVVAIAGLEKLKLDAYRTEVETYTVQTQAKNYEWQAYTAAWSGEETKVRAHLAQAQVYSAQLEGYKAKIAAQTATVDAQSKSVQATLGAYTADVTAFAATVSANAQMVGSQVEAQKALVNAYQVGSQAAIAQASAAAERFRAISTTAIEQARLSQQAVIEEARLFVQSMQNASQVALSAGQVMAGMSTAALSGVNTLVSTQTEATV